MKETSDKIHLSTKDFLVSGESFDLIYDRNLDILVTSPAPEESTLGKYYESDAYVSHTDDKKGLMNMLYTIVRKFSLSSKLGLITSFHGNGGSLLDVGAGTGEFLNLAKSKGWNICGVEPNAGAKQLASEKGITLETALERFDGQQFDVVTLWHVLEHLPKLKETIQKLEGLVKPGGSLIVAVPNFKSFDAKYYKDFWAAYDTPRHLWHFSRESMRNLFSESMELKKVKPMVFDSYYVSLLSEKYKTGNSFSIKAFFVGLWSNVSAWQTKEYSSLIYCFKKMN